MHEFLLVVCVVMGAGFYVAARLHSRKRRIYLPDFFIFMLGTHFAGALWINIVNKSISSVFVLEISSMALISATLVGSLVVSTSREPQRKPGNRLRYAKPKFFTYGLIATLLVNVSIVALLLSNPAIWNLLIATFVVDDATLLEVRKAITASTEGYMSPGLIKVFRDILSPIAVSAAIIGSRAGLKSVLLWVTILSIITAVIIGGQRFPMMVLIVMIAVSQVVRKKIHDNELRIRSLRTFLLYGVAGLALFSFLTRILGRGSSEEGPLAAILAPVTGILERVLFIVPNEANRTFFFWHPSGPSYGLSWLSDLATLVPGVSVSTFSSQLHQAGGGSAQGNAPLFFAADSWLAFGHVGVAISAAVFFLLYHFIDRVLWVYLSPLSYATRFLMMLYIPMMYSPFLFLLNGGIFVLPLIVMMIIHRNLAAPAAILPRQRHAPQSPLS